MVDNYFQNCPPMMQDQGRHLSDFQSDTRKNEYIKYINGIWRDDNYRAFLQNNGQTLLNREWAYNKMHNSCWNGPCVHRYPLSPSNRQMWQEREAYDSIFNVQTHNTFAPLRKCNMSHKDYRLSP